MILVRDERRVVTDLAAGAVACPRCAGQLRPARPRRIRIDPDDAAPLTPNVGHNWNGPAPDPW